MIIMNCTNLNRVGIESISVGGKFHLSLFQVHKNIQDQLSMLASCIAKRYAAQSRRPDENIDLIPQSFCKKYDGTFCLERCDLPINKK